MKLELEFCDDKNLQFALLNDIEDMEKMINSYLNFAKGIGTENSQEINITKTIKNLIRKLNKGKFDITFNTKKDYFAGSFSQLRCQPSALVASTACFPLWLKICHRHIFLTRRALPEGGFFAPILYLCKKKKTALLSKKLPHLG